MSSTPSAEEIARDATWLVQALDADKAVVRLVRMDAARYRDASFLDDRMFAERFDSAVVPWSDLPSDIATPATARWIFHIGHVGSTLVARLLGELDGVLSIREPRVLRDVAMLPPERREPFVPALRGLFARTFANGGMAVVKATSFVSEIAPELAGAAPTLLMYASPRNYIASILAGENSVKEMAALAPLRAGRVAGRAVLPQPSTPAEMAAAAWACEMTSLEATADALDATWADFDAMLTNMPAELARLAGALGINAPAERVTAIANGPLMRRYSKATEYAYSPDLRRELIAEATAHNRASIDSAVAMLQSAAERSPLLARALDRSG
ncbi:hypothetical protein H8M03_01725 [Sphingomonas sabuli]|uniref:Sulfotransferase family protein n=1 Tax=Sphingomonas sabuli TaxID=2764186 RepID=A0A7G9L3A8_9SPHN|nr:hypothetical protein [Sphingomonas sabuli]QNM83107.1 hypothetical protein H8M03_01725 [Sphingomonas sabuli]